MFAILKGYEVNNFTFQDGNKFKVLTLYFQGYNFEKKNTLTISAGTPLYSIQYKGNIDEVLPTLNIDAPYNVMTYTDSGSKRRYCNGLMQMSESAEV